ncbi:MAG TPA: type IV pilus assembly protein PilM, partial [bacterium]|nr:type IV pilus assembly protein PilM [bacterium]
KKETLAVDLGQGCIKVLKLSPDRAGLRAETLVTADFGFDPALSPEDSQKKRGQILASIWKEYKFRTKEVYLSVPGRGAIVRQFRIPRVTGDRLDRIVRFEAKQQIPIPLDQVILDYHCFDSGEPELDVTLIAIRKTAIEEYVAVLDVAKLRPDVIDVAPLCLFNALVDNEADPSEVVGLIDFGASETNIVIYQNKIVRFIRSAPVGGNVITESIQSQMGFASFAEAEEMKLSLSSQRSSSKGPESLTADQQRATSVVESSLDRILGEVRRSIDFFISKPEGEALTRVLITGGTSRIPGIEERIEERLGVSVTKADTFELAKVETAPIEAQGLAEVGPVVLGLGARAAGKSIVAMNFIPPSVKESKVLKQRTAYLVIQAALVLLTAFAGVLHINSQLKKYDEANQYLENIIHFEGVGDKAKDLLTELGKMNERFEKLKGVLNQRGRLSSMLFEIAKIAPPEIWLYQLRGSQRNFVLKGKCETRDAIKINEFIEVLNLNPFFSGIEVKTQVPKGDYVEFEIAVNELVTPDPNRMKLIDALRQKRMDFVFADLLLDQDKTAAYLVVYGSDDQQANDQQWPEIVDALVSSGVHFDRVQVMWMNRLRKKLYEQRCRREFCEQLQKDELSLEEFLKNVRFFEVKETKPEPQPGGEGVPPGGQ